MDNTFTHAVTHISLNKAAVSSINTLKDGGFVFVRILDAKTNGKVLVSFSGNIFEADSKLAQGLKAGDSFKAQLKIVNGNVNLIPVKDLAADLSQVTGEKSALYASICSAMGIPPDETSLKLLQFMRENAVYFTNVELQSLVKKAKLSGSKSLKYAEIAAFLKSKGIEPDDETVNEILSVFDAPEKKKKSKNVRNEQSEKLTGSFLDLLYKNPESLLKAKKGLLTLSNHLGNENSHWIILPFEKEIGSLWKGNIRILLDKSTHSVKKLYINAKNSEKSLIFEFFTPKNMHRVFEIRYAVEPEVSENEMGRFTKILETIFAAEGRSLEIVYDRNLLNEYFVDSGLFIKGADEVV